MKDETEVEEREEMEWSGLCPPPEETAGRVGLPPRTTSLRGREREEG